MDDDEYEVEFDEEGNDDPTAIRVFREPVTDKHDLAQWIAGYESGWQRGTTDALSVIRDCWLAAGEPPHAVEPLLDIIRRRLPGKPA